MPCRMRNLREWALADQPCSLQAELLASGKRNGASKRVSRPKSSARDSQHLASAPAASGADHGPP